MLTLMMVVLLLLRVIVMTDNDDTVNMDDGTYVIQILILLY